MVLYMGGKLGVIQQSCLVFSSNFRSKGPKLFSLPYPEINCVVADLENPTGINLGTPFIDEGDRSLS